MSKSLAMVDVITRFKVLRVRCEPHLVWVRTLPCAVCFCRGRYLVVAHHLTCSPEPKARGLKAGDNWTVPLCGIHHDPRSGCSVHAYKMSERAWWADFGLDPLVIAQKVAARSRALGILR